MAEQYAGPITCDVVEPSREPRALGRPTRWHATHHRFGTAPVKVKLPASVAGSRNSSTTSYNAIGLELGE